MHDRGVKQPERDTMSADILDAIDARKLGQELQRARKRSKMTQEAAASVIDATRTTMVAIEKGERRIRAGELIKLAEAYGRQVSDFLRPRLDIQSLDLQFRGPWNMGDAEEQALAPAIVEFEDLCRDYVELELFTDSPLARKYPPEYTVSGLPIDSTVEAIATEERNRLGLGDRPLPILRDVLEQDVGLRIFYIEMPHDFSEMYAYTDQLGGCFAVNALHPEERRRWSLAHGYFHFLANRHRGEVYGDRIYQRKPESERFADAFADYFLMPSAGLMQRFNEAKQQGSLTPATLCIWANAYGVSVEAITRRLESMRLLPTGSWTRLRPSLKIRELQRQLGLNEIPANESKVPARFVYLAVEAWRREQLGEDQLARYLETDLLDIRRMIAEESSVAQDAEQEHLTSNPPVHEHREQIKSDAHGDHNQHDESRQQGQEDR